MTTTAEPTVDPQPAEDRKPDDTKPRLQAWQGPLVVENSPTGDRRRIMPGAITARELPLTMMLQRETPAGGLGGNPHAGARAAGHIEMIWPGENGIQMGAGVFDTGEDGQEAARMRRENTLRGLSVDLCDSDAQVGCLQMGADGECDKEELQITQGTIMGVTITPFPALPEAQFELIDADQYAALSAQYGQQLTSDAEVRYGVPIDLDDLPDVLHAAGGPPLPPEEWFGNPELAHPTPFTITDDGRVYGHAAQWGVCHISMQDHCVTAPRSATGYSHFTVGARRAACCCDQPQGEAEIPTGPIMLGTTHAAERLRWDEANAHYANTGVAVADVAAGEDDHGIWVAGALRPGLSDDKIRELRAAALSGDWRKIGGNLELVAVLAVNVPGFGVERTKFHTAEGKQTSLVAAGVIVEDPLTPTDALEMQSRSVASLEKKVDELYRIVAEPVLVEEQMARLEQFAPAPSPKSAPDRPQAQRDADAKSGVSMPGGGYPIRNCGDAVNARRAIGRAAPGDRQKVLAHIASREKALNCNNGPKPGSK